ncbi:MAG: MarR family transcriptional regulator [Rhodospirillaceae bacterium]|nr:MarR family transcriptional regulator [Rhodospirillaceae bacterium]
MARSPVYSKYGEAAVAGFQAVPDVLLKHQTRLGLSPTNLVVLLNVLMHWWYPEQRPFPRPTTIAKRMGLSARAVQRSIQQLQQLGLVVRERSEDGRTFLNPDPLVAKLEELAKQDADYEYRRHSRRYGEITNREGESGPHRLPRGRDFETPF